MRATPIATSTAEPIRKQLLSRTACAVQNKHCIRNVAAAVALWTPNCRVVQPQCFQRFPRLEFEILCGEVALFGRRIVRRATGDSQHKKHAQRFHGNKNSRRKLHSSRDSPVTIAASAGFTLLNMSNSLRG